MDTTRLPRVRFAMHAASFFGTFAILLPMLASARVPRGVPLDPELFTTPLVTLAGVQALASVCLGVGTALVGLAAGTLAAGGGTADPFDPPLRFVDDGVYAWLRHPMQLGQI